MSGWHTKRAHPYTENGIRRVGCIRCGAPAAYQWNICADGNHYRPICGRCDVELNAVVLVFMGHPNVDGLIRDYRSSKNALYEKDEGQEP